ncbi:MAG TPA: CoA ester lyase [Gryllotalpicola sp.]
MSGIASGTGQGIGSGVASGTGSGIRLDAGPALLFCPGNRPERFAKAAARADAVIVDLEDAVPAAQKEDARRAVVASGLDPRTTLIRVNAGSSAELDRDLAALDGSGFRLLVAGKCESVDAVAALSDYDVVPQIETPKGYLQLEAIAAHPAVVALFWGTEDFVEQLGGTAARDGSGRLIDPLRAVRARLMLTAAAFGKPAIDAPYPDYSESGLTGLGAQARDAARSGFLASACVHPAQVPVVRTAYRPDEAAIARARQVLADAEGTGGVFASGGGMVDAPVVEQARRVLARAAAPAAG